MAFAPPRDKPYAGRAGNRRVINPFKIILKQMMTALNLQMIASAGGTVEVNAANYTALNLQMIANAGKNKGAELIVKNANKLTALNCQMIASANPGHVHFDFT